MRGVLEVLRGVGQKDAAAQHQRPERQAAQRDPCERLGRHLAERHHGGRRVGSDGCPAIERAGEAEDGRSAEHQQDEEAASEHLEATQEAGPARHALDDLHFAGMKGDRRQGASRRIDRSPGLLSIRSIGHTNPSHAW